MPASLLTARRVRWIMPVQVPKLLYKISLAATFFLNIVFSFFLRFDWLPSELTVTSLSNGVTLAFMVASVASTSIQRAAGLLTPEPLEEM